MKNLLINITLFAAGAAIGSAVTWKIVKTKYEQIAQEEIDSVKEVYSRKKTTNDLDGVPEEEPIESIEEESKTILKECNDIINNMGYSNAEDESEDEIIFHSPETTQEEWPFEAVEPEKGGLAFMPHDKPYVICPDEFDEIGYNVVSLLYFSDKVLTDDMYEEVEDIEGTVGIESLDHFGEWEDDSVFVRNDALKCDYEILLDSRRYQDLLEDE